MISFRRRYPCDVSYKRILKSQIYPLIQYNFTTFSQICQAITRIFHILTKRGTFFAENIDIFIVFLYNTLRKYLFLGITMKIKIKKITYEEALSIPIPTRKKLPRPNFLFKCLIRLLSIPDLMATKFSYTTSGMEKAGKGPYLILMNHSSFIDLKIASKIFFRKPYYIVCTSDGFIGKNWLMRRIGCIPAKKFVADISMTRDILRAIKEKKKSVLLFPEASYTFDGTATPLPRKLGQLLKKLDVPVVSVITEGAFLRQPLYNNLKLRKTKVSAKVTCLLTREEIAEKSVQELDEILDNTFSFDNFARQYETKTKIDEPFRADGLNRILYRCAECNTEGEMEGKGTELICRHCGKTYHMDEYGRLRAIQGETQFPHIPDWYAWQRECVKNELLTGNYKLDLDVEIGMMIDFKQIYMVGAGKLIHDNNGFTLTGCDGKLHYTQSPLSSYGLYSDYYWYQIDDVICIGDKKYLYYCFPKQKDVVAKARIAAEELYKIQKQTV